MQTNHRFRFSDEHGESKENLQNTAEHISVYIFHQRIFVLLMKFGFFDSLCYLDE